jgi:ADP-ribose pyrophosphatase YjhB (NUDIX family)
MVRIWHHAGMNQTENRADGILVGVGAVIWNADGQVLLIRRTKAPGAGHWSLPGGKVERGETLEQALRREVREETGLEVEILGLAGVAEITGDAAIGSGWRHYVLIDYGVRATSGVARAGSDAADATWFAYADLAGLGLWSETLRVIAESARRHMGLAA